MGLLRSKDDDVYICLRCRTLPVDDNSRMQFDIPQSIPDQLKNELINKCKYKDTIFSDLNRFGPSDHQFDYILLNKLE